MPKVPNNILQNVPTSGCTMGRHGQLIMGCCAEIIKVQVLHTCKDSAFIPVWPSGYIKDDEGDVDEIGHVKLREWECYSLLILFL